MSGRYEDCLGYLPSKERKAAEEALYLGKDAENLAINIIRQMNRSNTNPRKQLRNLR